MRCVDAKLKWCTALCLVALAATVMHRTAAAEEPSLEDLKARFASTSIADRPHLCVHIAKRQAAETDRLYAANDFEKAETALTDVVAYSELARDYAIQSRKYQKQTEIAVREFARKLGDLMHTLPHDDQTPVREAIARLQKVRDDLLAAMFPKGAK